MTSSTVEHWYLFSINASLLSKWLTFYPHALMSSIFSPFLKMFLLELPRTEFSKTEHNIWKPRNSHLALQYSVLYCFATKPETNTTTYHHPPSPPWIPKTNVIWLPYFLLSLGTSSVPLPTALGATTTTRLELVCKGRSVCHPSSKLIITFLRVVWDRELALTGEWQDHSSPYGFPPMTLGAVPLAGKKSLALTHCP